MDMEVDKNNLLNRVDEIKTENTDVDVKVQATENSLIPPERIKLETQASNVEDILEEEITVEEIKVEISDADNVTPEQRIQIDGTYTLSVSCTKPNDDNALSKKTTQTDETSKLTKHQNLQSQIAPDTSFDLSSFTNNTMNKVDNLLKKSFSSSTSEEKLEIKRLGAHQPRNIQISQRDGKINRKFSSTWFDKIEWLTVSEEKKSFFCFFCLLFGGESPWTYSGITDLKHISERIRTHECTMNHINNAVQFKMFGKVNVLSMTNSGLCQSVSRHNELVDKNRHGLSRIIECIKFCGVHEQPLRGHDETMESNKRGMFLDFVEWTASLDNVLDDHLKNSRMAKTSSKTIKNELLDCIYEVYIDEIKTEMNKVNFVSIQADETTDVACRSQFVVVLRYLKDSQSVERFLAYVDVDDRTPCGLTKILQEILSPFSINDKLIAQGYNGSAVICGSRNGVQIKMRETYPYAHYVHCYGHQLDLVLTKACSSIKRIKLFLSTISGISDFFNSPKRNSLLRKVSEALIPKVCETRWNFTLKIINCVKENRDRLLKCFEIIQQEDGWDDKSIWEATLFMKCLKDGEFNFFLSFFYVVFKQVDFLYKILQSKDATNIFVARALENFELAIDRIMESSKDFYQLVDDDIQNPEKRPRRELNSTKIDTLQICVVEASIIIKDEIWNRFGNSEIFKSFDVVDPKQFKIHKENFPIEHVNVLTKNYPMLRIEKFKSELSVVYNNDIFKNCTNIYELCKFITDLDLKDTMSEVSKMIEIVLVTPVSTADAETSFSMSKRIRTYIRNTISQNRLNALALLSIHKEFIKQIPFFNKKVIEKFISMKDRREEYLIYK